MKLLIIHGPNLALLGKREPDVYGKVNLEDINKEIKDLCDKNNVEVEIKQFDCEGDIVTCIGNADVDGVIINPAGYTHTSVAIGDAVRAIDIPVIEVHLSNIYAREEFRHISMVAPCVVGQISGFGKQSYIMALEYFIKKS
jgi:3-dehydroquinate dehydratase II